MNSVNDNKFESVLLSCLYLVTVNNSLFFAKQTLLRVHVHLPQLHSTESWFPRQYRYLVQVMFLVVVFKERRKKMLAKKDC